MFKKLKVSQKTNVIAISQPSGLQKDEKLLPEYLGVFELMFILQSNGLNTSPYLQKLTIYKIDANVSDDFLYRIDKCLV